MCEAVIVVESDVAGGSMITARFAGEQGRQIMAVPGRIDQASSAGCHQLIRDGATMVTSVDDILEELRYRRPETGDASSESEKPREAPGELNLSEIERAVMACFAGGETCGPDRIADQTARPVAEISALLMGLEIKKLVVKRADGRFEAKK
jgi:DNA processing protein